MPKVRRFLNPLLLITFLPVSSAGQVTPLGGAFQVNTYTFSYQNWGSNDRIGHGVAIAPNGDFLVTWNSDQSGNSPVSGLDVFAQRYSSDGSPAGSEFQVNTFTNHNQFAPDVAADGQGNFIVVWSGYVPTSFVQSVGGQRFDSNGTPLGTEFAINAGQGSSVAPVVAADAAGDFIVVWNDLGSFGVDVAINAQRFDSSGAKQGTEFQVAPLGPFDATPRQSVAMDEVGNSVVVWMSGQIFGQRFDSNGAALGTQFQASSYPANSDAYPQVAAAPNGDFVVVWQNSNGEDGQYTGIFGQRFTSSGERLGSEFQVNTYTPQYQSFPDVAMDAAGDFIVTWGSFKDTGIVARRYHSDGFPEGTEFGISHGNEARSAVASAPNGDFTAVWLGGDGSLTGIFGGRFAVPTPLPSATPTETNTPLPSPTPSITATITVTSTPTVTFTPTLTPTITETPTTTPSFTATPTVTPSDTPTFTATPTVTNSATNTPTSTLTASPTPPDCLGDCNRNQHVTIDELIDGVSIGLGEFGRDRCPPFDPANDGRVTIADLLRGMNNAVQGCP